MSHSISRFAPVLLCMAASSASATPFQYGDIFVSSPSGIYRFNQSGTLVQTISGVSGLGIAFDNSGNLYVASGASIQKIDNSGNPLGTFVSAFPGTFGTATGIDFDHGGNAYVAGIQDGSNDFIRKYTTGGVVLGTQSFLQGQENWVYVDHAGGNTLLLTPGTTSLVDVFNSATLAPTGSVFITNGGPNGQVEGLPGGGFLVITGDPIDQYDSAGHLVMTYNTPVPTHGTWIGVDLATPTTFWAVTDFGEVNKFNLGTSTPVASFSAGVDARAIAVYTLPEPSAFVMFGTGIALLGLRLVRRRN